MHTIIAIDGGAGTGKSTTARRVAERLGFTYLDTGAMYRAITYKAISQGVPPQEGEALGALLARTRIGFDGSGRVLVDGVPCEAEIRGPGVSGQVSLYAALPSVRGALTEQQRAIGARQDCVLDGRDIGTVVFPQARHKFFLTTTLEVRARRRWLELREKGEDASLEAVRANLAERDRIDSTRSAAPLRKADDAIEIDTSELTIEGQVAVLLDFVNSKTAKH
jgi:cytidylate kinase